jgi:hypothetical protein
VRLCERFHFLDNRTVVIMDPATKYRKRLTTSTFLQDIKAIPAKRLHRDFHSPTATTPLNGGGCLLALVYCLLARFL